MLTKNVIRFVKLLGLDLENKLKFVGEKHWEAVQRIIEFLDDEHSPVFLVTGEPGMGKSRVLEEFMEHPLFEGNDHFVKKLIVYRDDSIATILMSWLEDLVSKISLFKGNKDRWKSIIKAIPQFGDALSLFIKDSTKPAKQKFLDALNLVSEKLNKSERLVIVVDPYVDLRTHENAEILEHFIAECPPKVKFVVAQRLNDKLMKFSKFIRLVSDKETKIGKIPEESYEKIIENTPALKNMDEEDRNEFIRKTDGWPLAMSDYAKKISNDPENAKTIINGLPKELQTAIENDYKNLDKNSRSLVETLSLLGAAIDFQTLNALLDDIDEGEMSLILDSKEVSKLVVTATDKEEKQVFKIRHALFSDWIVKLLKSRLNITKRYLEIAAYFKSRFEKDNRQTQDLVQYVNYLHQSSDEKAFEYGAFPLGPILYGLSLYDALLDICKKLLPIYQKNKTYDKEGHILNNIASVYRVWGRNNEAFHYLVSSLTIFRKIGDPISIGNTLNNLSQIQITWGMYDAALNTLEQCIEIYQQIGEQAGAGRALVNISLVLNSMGKSDEALEYLERSLTISREIGDRITEGTTLNNIGQLYANKGNLKKALQFMNQFYEIMKEIGNRSGECESLNNIASLYLDMGENQKSLNLFTQSLEISLEINDKVVEASILNNIGMIYEKNGKHNEAIEAYLKSLEILQMIGDRPREGITLNNIAKILIDIGEYNKAVDFITESLAISKEIRNKEMEANARIYSSVVYYKLGEVEKAVGMAKIVVDIYKKSKHPEYNSSLIYLNHLKSKLKKSQK